ncbi:SacI homology domain-containing protein [Blastocladiella britannica]|nr:SacI homology domain-containing protein [Blastocladiella britannica]
MAAFNRLRLYISNDAYTIEPIVFSSTDMQPRLVIHRDTGAIEVLAPTAAVPIGYYSESVEIDGVLGLVPLLAGDYLVVITRKTLVGRLFPDAEHDVYSVQKTRILPVPRSVLALSDAQRRDEDTFLSLLDRMCSLGHMYFSPTWDLTSTVQVNLTRETTNVPLWQRTDRRFFWNHYLQSKLIDLTVSFPHLHNFILPVICGYVKTVTAHLNRKVFTYVLITRKRVHRVGTRYHSRGIDVDGHVANYVETEQVISYQVPVDLVTHVRSYVQIRGSIPLYWRQKVNSKYTPLLEVVQKPTSRKAFAAHVNEQFQIYGDSQVMVNLINKKGYELPLGNAFQDMVKQHDDPRLTYIHFDFHEECKKMRYYRISVLEQQIAGEVAKQNNFACELPRLGKPRILTLQQGVIRTNCIDCLDRTNVVQSVLAKSVLTEQLRALGVLPSPDAVIDPQSDFERAFKNLWADNADVVSTLYSGTGALKTDFTRTGKRSKQGALQDGYNSVMRYVKNNFLDGARQDAYDVFLGVYRPADAHAVLPGTPIARGGTESSSPFAIPRVRQAHTLVLATVMTASAFATLALLLAREWSELLRAWIAVSFLLWIAVAFLVNKHGFELVDLPRLVPVDYVRDRQLGLGSPLVLTTPASMEASYSKRTD